MENNAFIKTEKYVDSNLNNYLKEIGYHVEDFDIITSKDYPTILNWLRINHRLHVFSSCSVNNNDQIEYKGKVQDIKTGEVLATSSFFEEDEENAIRRGILQSYLIIKNRKKLKFNLELAKKGTKIELNNGNKARIVCFDAKREYNLVVLVSEFINGSEIENVYYYNEFGIRENSIFKSTNLVIIND